MKTYKKILGLMVVFISVFGLNLNVKAAGTTCSSLDSAKVKKAEADECYVDLKTALNDVKTSGGNLKLLEDVSLDEKFEVTSNISIDLADKKITGTGARNFEVKDNGALTLKGNGYVINEVGESDGNIYVYGGSLTIENGVTVGGISPVVVSAISDSNSGTITINGHLNNYTKQPGIDSSALAVHGSIKSGTATITIGSTAILESTIGAAIYQAGYANTTIDGELTGLTGIVIKSGKLTLNSNASIEATGSKPEEIKPCGDGYTSSGAAIQIESTTNYAGNIELEVKGGTYTSKNNAAVLEYSDNGDASVTSLKIEGGKFTAAENHDTVVVSENLAGDTGKLSELEHKVTLEGEQTNGTYTVSNLTEDNAGEFDQTKVVFGRLVKVSTSPNSGYVANVTVTKDNTAGIRLMSAIAPDDDVKVTRSGNDFVFAMPNYNVKINVTFIKASSSSSNKVHYTVAINKTEEEKTDNFGKTLRDLFEEIKASGVSSIKGFTDEKGNKLNLDTLITSGSYYRAILSDNELAPSETPKTLDTILSFVGLGIVSIGAIGIASKKYVLLRK